MRVLSLVPSLTESLAVCGVDLVGRTRYCLYPADVMANLPVVGGTKAADFSRLQNVDLVIFDKEENRREMAEQCPFPFYACHITDLASLAFEFEALSQLLSNPKLSEWATLLRQALSRPIRERELQQMPGLLAHNSAFLTAQYAQYLIWQKPFMAIGKNTFIADMFKHLGLEKVLLCAEEKYPQLEALIEDPQRAYLLSSEPYPFAKEWSKWRDSAYPCALVDGEAYSWYGIRAIEFLRRHP